MNYIRHLNTVLERLISDHRILPRHVTLYMVLFQVWNKLMFANPITVVRQEMMALAKIGSANTYIKTMKELDSWGYVTYLPSKSAFQPSSVTITTFDNSTDNTSSNSTDTSSDSSADNSSDNSTGITTDNSTDNSTDDSTDDTTDTSSSNSDDNSSDKSTDNTFYKLLNNNYKTITNNNKPLLNSRESAREEKSKDQIVPPEKGAYEKKKGEIKKPFIKPTLSALEIFFQEKKTDTIEAQRFFNHFESNGWKVGGKSPMKDWKAAARNWILNISKFGYQQPQQENTTEYLSTNNDKDYGEPL